MAEPFGRTRKKSEARQDCAVHHKRLTPEEAQSMHDVRAWAAWARRDPVQESRSHARSGIR